MFLDTVRDGAYLMASKMEILWRRIHSAHLLAVIWIFTGSFAQERVSEGDLISIVPDLPWTDVAAGQNFELKCTGRRRVTWDYPLPEDQIQLRHDGSAGSFSSSLTVLNPTGFDTGRYFCRYDNVRETEGGLGGNRSIYVFVNDPNQLFKPPPREHSFEGLPEFVTVTQNKPSTLACLPTYSRARVQLLNANTEPSRPVEESDVTYDPTEGFVVRFPNVFFTGHFICQYEVQFPAGAKTAKQLLQLYYDTNQDPPMPAIDSTGAQHAEASTSFSLKCEVRSAPEDFVRLEWILPSDAIARRATFNRSTVEEKSSSYRYKIIQNTLSVRDVEMTDEGTYVCWSAFTNREEIKIQTATYVKIYPAGQSSHVDVVVPVKRVEVAKGSSTQLMIQASGYPKPATTWRKDGRTVLFQSRFSRVENHNSSGIRIVSSESGDAGIYTAVVTAGATREEVNVSLVVNEAAQVTLVHPKRPPFFLLQTVVEFQCIVTGFPTPNVILAFAPCSRSCPSAGPENGDQDFVDLPRENYIETIDITGRTTTVRYSRTMVGDSGFLRCFAENGFNGQRFRVKKDVRILVTDVEEGFNTTMKPPSPAEFENVTFTCQANNYVYTNVRWEKKPFGYDEIYRPVQHSTDVKLSSASDNPFSHVVQLVLPEVQRSMQGQYRCVADLMDAGGLHRAEPYDLRVRGAEIPVFAAHVLDDVEAKNVDYQQRLELDCEAIASPAPRYTWTKNNAAVITSGATRLEKNDAKLVNSKFTQDDQGEYLCVASNAKGKASKTWKVSGGVPTGERRKVYIIVGSCTGAFMVILLVLGVLFWIKWKKQKKRIEELEYLEGMMSNDTANPDLIDPSVPLSEQVALLPYNDQWEVDPDKLKLLNKVLGTGQFGKVVKAEARDLHGKPGVTIVAVKMLKETADLVQRKSLLGEIKIMMHIGQHLNVVNLLGACTKNMAKGEIYMLMEYCAHGSLRDYLQRHQGPRFFNQVDVIEGVLLPLSEEQVTQIGQRQNELPREKDFDGRILTTRDLISFAYQVSCGMEYLAQHHVIHRDLAGRNVLVAENNIMKICDFGLARQEYSEYIKKNQAELPVKWMAIECIYNNVFSTESDVWSFGILLWELFTLGCSPYPGINIDSDFVERIKNGYRMERPYLSPKDMYEMMRQCWEENPKNRPTFRALTTHLGAMIGTAEEQKYVALNVPFITANEAHNDGYVNQGHFQVGKGVSEPDSAGTGKNYFNMYKMLPGKKQAEMPTKPKRNIRPTGTQQDALSAMELQPILRPDSKSPSPSRPGNLVENEDYLNDQFVAIPVNKTPNRTYVNDVGYKPSFSDHSSGFVSDDVSPRSERTHHSMSAVGNQGPMSSEV